MTLLCKLAKGFNHSSVLSQVGVIVFLSVLAADLLTLIFYSIFFADRLLLDLVLTTVIVIAVATPLSYYFLGRSARIAELAAELDRAGRIDHLTGLLNRKTFLEQAAGLLGASDEAGGTATLLFIDADHFKSVNDTFGHAAGDAVLRELAHVLRASIEAGDLAGRLGGEEFAVLLADAGYARTELVCETIRRKVKAIARITGLEGRQITVSIGASRHRPGQDLEALLLEADRNLYTAKTTGRDRTVHGDTGLAA